MAESPDVSVWSSKTTHWTAKGAPRLNNIHSEAELVPVRYTLDLKGCWTLETGKSGEAEPEVRVVVVRSAMLSNIFLIV
jgi:hypothetical protein